MFCISYSVNRHICFVYTPAAAQVAMKKRVEKKVQFDTEPVKYSFSLFVI